MIIKTNQFQIHIRDLFPNGGILLVTVYEHSHPKTIYGEFKVNLDEPSTFFTDVEFRNDFGFAPEFCKKCSMPINKIRFSKIIHCITLEECFEIQYAVSEAIKWIEFWK